ncbi:cytochrome P450 [Halostella sp. JP-L12]|uniref:cytochrome P450 n=1 Tax=Halostella TaxID=1843185 RepID=UPI0013CF313B|nr:MULTISPECIES: cytochrome P450 [Halostella]NHN46662.1 cytochrome P450 [Halostella sp. JP-L12]
MSTTPPPAADGLPVLGQTVELIRDQLGLHDAVAEEYGDVVRIRTLGVGEYCLLSHPDHVERALIEEPEAFAKTDDFGVAFGESVGSTEGEQWRRQRDALEEFFYPGRIRSYVDDVVRITRRRVDRWADGDRISVRREMDRVALANFFGAVFGRELDPEGDETLRRAAGDLNLWFEPTSFALPNWVPTPAHRRFHEAVETLRAEGEALLAERKRGDLGDDLLSTLVELRGGGGADLSDREIVDQVTGLTFAGYETTALLLSYALYLLGTHDEVRERFHAELDGVLGGDAPTLSDVGKLTTTERIVHETLRRYPPVFMLPRVTTRPVDLGGYRLPEGMRTHVSIWRLHRDERFWDAPDDWRPARWRDASPADKGCSFVPFGAGPRACLAQRFALLEAVIALATVGQRYRVEPLRDLALDPAMTLQPAHDMPARLRRRARDGE